MKGVSTFAWVAAGSYYELADRFPRLGTPGASRRAEVGINGGELDPNGGELDPDGGELGPNGGEPLAEQRRLVHSLGKKPRVDKLRSAIEILLAERWWTPRELAGLLGRDSSSLVEDHLGPMTQQGKLMRRHAEPNHPEQAYRAIQSSLFSTKPEGE